MNIVNIEDNYVEVKYKPIIENLEKIISNDRFKDLPDIYQNGLNKLLIYSKDEYKFYSDLFHQPFERKVLACDKIFRSTIEAKLITNNHFYYQMFVGIPCVPSKKLMELCKSARVVYSNTHDNRFMLYNPDFILYNYKIGGLKAISFIICHEMCHIILGHDYRRESINSFNILENTKTLENIGHDLHINSFLSQDDETLELIMNGVFPGIFPYHDFPKGLSSDEYITLLRQKDSSSFNIFDIHSKLSNQTLHDFDLEDLEVEIDEYEPNKTGSKQSNGSGGSGSSSNSSGSNNSSDKTKKENNKQKDLMEKLYDMNKIDKAIMASKGQMSNSVSNIVDKYIKSKEVKFNPYDIFNYFLQQSDNIVGKETSSRKLNKKSPYRLPGSKFIRNANIAFYCDMSGSVDDNLLSNFFDVVKKCCDNGREFDFIPFTTSIDTANIVTIDASSPPVLRTATGGTDFRCINSHAIENGYSGVVVLTDMEASYPGEIGIPRLWVTNHDMKDFNSETVLNFSRCN